MADSSHGADNAQTELNISCCIEHQRNSQSVLESYQKDTRNNLKGLLLAKDEIL